MLDAYAFGARLVLGAGGGRGLPPVRGDALPEPLGVGLRPNAAKRARGRDERPARRPRSVSRSSPRRWPAPAPAPWRSARPKRARRAGKASPERRRARACMSLAKHTPLAHTSLVHTPLVHTSLVRPSLVHTVPRAHVARAYVPRAHVPGGVAAPSVRLLSPPCPCPASVASAFAATGTSPVHTLPGGVPRS